MAEKSLISDTAEIAINVASRLPLLKHRWVHLASRLEKAGLDAGLSGELKIAAELSRDTSVEISRQESKWLLEQDDLFWVIELRRRAGASLRYKSSELGYEEIIKFPRPLAATGKWISMTVFLVGAIVSLGTFLLALLALLPPIESAVKGTTESIVSQSIPAIGRFAVLAILSGGFLMAALEVLKSFASTRAIETLMQLSKKST